ncbi:endo-1,3-1,4-beta-glycanase ExoK [Microdochium nivale]|nr:endo-1,3-1,4-beta-glycanase ExoK [Microdochium nivale]
MGVTLALRAGVALLGVSLVHAQATYQQVSDDKCNCYLTNGTDANYFSAHKFYDFRRLSQYAGVPKSLTSVQGNADADVTSDFFRSNGFTSAWEIQNWNNSARLNSGEVDATVLFVNSPNNIFIESNKDPKPASETYMTMRTARVGDFQTGAEIESKIADYHYLSVRMFARTVGSPGAITAMFTYKGAEQITGVQESDLEIRTMDPPQFVQYTNQPAYTPGGGGIPEATRNITMPRGLTYRDWAVWRLDWTPTTTTHFVNGEQVSSIAFQNPRDPLQVFFNSWSDGGSWSGVMKRGDEAFLQIQWIELVYNKAGDALASRATNGDPQCGNVCSIDESSTVGAAVLIKSSGRSVQDGVLHKMVMATVSAIAVVIWTCT